MGLIRCSHFKFPKHRSKQTVIDFPHGEELRVLTGPDGAAWSRGSGSRGCTAPGCGRRASPPREHTLSARGLAASASPQGSGRPPRLTLLTP